MIGVTLVFAFSDNGVMYGEPWSSIAARFGVSIVTS